MNLHIAVGFEIPRAHIHAARAARSRACIELSERNWLRRSHGTGGRYGAVGMRNRISRRLARVEIAHEIAEAEYWEQARLLDLDFDPFDD
jgi:hypothetical protein